jgi:hypothetical protein
MVTFLFYNFFRKAKPLTRPQADIIKNMRLVQLIMGLTSDATDNMFEYIEEYLYWKNPDKTMELVKEMLKLPIPLAFGLYFLPIRYFLVAGLWITAGKNSPFFKSIITITISKG